MRLFLFVLASLILGGTAHAQALRVVAEAYPGWAHADGTGYYFELLGKVYEGSDVRLAFHTVPFTRAVKMIEAGSAEITPVTYRGDLPDEHLSLRVTTATDLVAAVYRPETIPHWAGPESLAGLRVGALKGYALGQFLPAGAMYSEEPDVAGLLRMLHRQRIDVLLDFEERLQALMAGETALVKRKGVIRIPGFAAFASTPGGRHAKQLFEARLPALLGTPAMQELFRKYEISTDEQPRLTDLRSKPVVRESMVTVIP